MRGEPDLSDVEPLLFKAERLCDEAIVHPGLDPAVGENINGPSLIAAPPWLSQPLARYYLYFADHQGSTIRLALADRLTGPWRIHPGGCLSLEESHFCIDQPPPPGPRPKWADSDADWLTPHIASPDVHLLPEARSVRMYFHGLLADGTQMTRVALSEDGLSFRVRPDLLGPSYFRVFRHGAWHYALVMPNRILRSRDGLAPFEEGPCPLPPQTRHSAVVKEGDRLRVFWSEFGDCPERLKQGTLDLSGDWRSWRLSNAAGLLASERPWEGADLPVEASRIGAVHEPVHQLRDPCVFVEKDRRFLLYSAAGESGIGIAELHSIA